MDRPSPRRQDVARVPPARIENLEPPRRTDRVPGVVGRFHELLERVDQRRLAVFLDQDGTLAPIAARPEDASVPRATREVLQRLAAVCPVTIVTGRDAADARGLLGVDTVTVIGNHGLETARPGKAPEVDAAAEAFVPKLQRAADLLDERLGPIRGAWVERKRFSVVAHDREVAEEDLGRVREEVQEVAAGHPDLRSVQGRRIHELRPRLAVDKGVAVRRCIDDLGGPEEVAGVYVGDDTTDEDALYVLRDDGIGVVVRDGARLRQTWAHFGIGGPHEITELLELLIDAATRD